jgi:hypothetical protein
MLIKQNLTFEPEFIKWMMRAKIVKSNCCVYVLKEGEIVLACSKLHALVKKVWKLSISFVLTM